MDTSNRPLKTPRHESVILIFLEKEYSPGKIQTALNHLEELNGISSIKKSIRNVGEAKFYFSSKLNKDFIQNILPNKIDKAAHWISKYSDIKITKMLGEHLHYLVKAELRAHGFKIVSEKNVRSYGNKIWNRTKHSLDMVAIHQQKNLEIGVEVKNMLTLPPKSEIVTKIEMCEHLGIIPVFASRWMEPYRSYIQEKNGFLWQFKTQIYPLGQENFVTEIQKRFQLPAEVIPELPSHAIMKFSTWLENPQKS